MGLDLASRIQAAGFNVNRQPHDMPLPGYFRVQLGAGLDGATWEASVHTHPVCTGGHFAELAVLQDGKLCGDVERYNTPEQVLARLRGLLRNPTCH